MKRKPTSSAKSSEPTKPTTESRLYRSETNRILGGVAGGLGEYLQVDPTLIRIAFMFMTIFGGSGFLLYFVLWLVIPTRLQSGTSEDYIKENVEEFKQKTQDLGNSIRSQPGNTRYFIGLIILGMGILFLLDNFGIFSFFRIERLWPLVLVVLGFLILSRK